MKKSFFLLIIIITLLFWTKPVLIVNAEREEEEYEDEDEDEEDEEEDEDEDEDEEDEDEDEEDEIIEESPQAPAIEETPAPIQEPVTITPKPNIQTTQTINQLIKNIPPIIIKDDNENGIVDDIEKLYKK